MTGHRTLEKKQITQGNNRKVQNPSESLLLKLQKACAVIRASLLFLQNSGFWRFVGDLPQCSFQSPG